MAEPDLNNQQVNDWAAEAERDQCGTYKEDYDAETGIRTVTSETESELKEVVNGKEETFLVTYLVISKYRRIEKVVPTIVALRKKWKKFGECIRDQNDVNPINTFVDQEQKWEWIRNITGEEIIEQTDIMKEKGASGVGNCRICKSVNHWTVQCPYKDRFGAVDEEGPPPAEDFTQNKSTPGTYTPMHMRIGVTGPSLSNRNDEASLRITNLPPDTQEQDLRAHIVEHVINAKRAGNRPMGLTTTGRQITRLYLAKKKNREGIDECKGFAYVTFDTGSLAEFAKEKLQGSRFNYSILSVESSQRKN